MESSEKRKKRKVARADACDTRKSRRFSPAPSTSVLEAVTAKMNIHVHPSSLLDVDLGVREHVNSLLLKYNEQLDGIPVAYRDVKQLSKTSVVSPYFPLCKMGVEASFTLIRPREGALVEGRVTEITDTFIGMLLFNLVNVVIEVGNVQGFSYSLFDHRWKNVRDAGHGIAHGDMVRCRVIRVEKHGGGYCTISGSLGKGCGNVEHLKNDEEVEEKKRKKKAARKENKERREKPKKEEKQKKEKREKKSKK
jgi:hypothetical protein